MSVHPNTRKQSLELIKRLLIVTALAYVFFWAASGVRIDLARLQRGLPAIGRILDAMFPPDWSMRQRAIDGMMQSFYIAVWGQPLEAFLQYL